MKKALIITYYWPPAGGTGTQRCLKFAKHLPEFNWEPIIFTSSNRSEQAIDLSLNEELPEGIKVHSIDAWEPYKLYRAFTGRSKNEAASPHLNFSKKPGQRDRFSKWVRDQFFIPDARKFWIRPSVNFLSRYLSENKIDVIFTSGPPHSTHLIGLALKKQFPKLKWVADFRDPWLHINTYHKSAVSAGAIRKQLKLEHDVLKNADVVITVGDQIRDDLAGKVHHDQKNKFHTITNSFETYATLPAKTKSEKFTLTHAGTLYPNRSSTSLWKALASLIEENKNFAQHFELNLVGKVDAEVLSEIGAFGLNSHLRKTGFISHQETQIEMMNSEALLVLVNNVPDSGGILTGKFFEYLGAKKPIIAIGPQKGNLATIMLETNCGFMIDYSDEKKMKEAILEIFEGKYNFNPTNTEKYSAKSVTQQLAELFDRNNF